MSDARQRAYRIITFYSYKGGVGRSMAVANVAALLSKWGRRVLVIDFDLEAPGIERYFDQPNLVWMTPSSPSRGETGLVDLLIAMRGDNTSDWRKHIVELAGHDFTAPLHLLPAGSRGKNYAAKVQSLNWDELFAKHDLGERLAAMREEWADQYDVVLIDSRTGMSDIGGVCTIVLPDALVMLFTANSQSIEGTAEVAGLARRAQEDLPVERARLLTIPMLSRDDRASEYEQSEHWRGIVAETMRPFFSEWVSQGVTAEMVLQKMYLPQVSFWSFGERLPVIEKPQELEDPRTLGSAYLQLAQLIDADFRWSAVDTTLAGTIASTTGVSKSASFANAATTSIYDPGITSDAGPPIYQRRWPLLALSTCLVAAAVITLALLRFDMAPSQGPTLSSIPTPSIASSMDVASAQALIGSNSASDEERINALVFLSGSDAVPRGALLDGLTLSGRITRLRGCVNCSFIGADLHGVSLDNGFFSQTNFAGANLANVSIVNASFEAVDLSNANLRGALFDGTKFVKVSLTLAQLARNQLTVSQLGGSTGTPAWIATPSTVAGAAGLSATSVRTDQFVGGNTANGWDVDVFWCDAGNPSGSYAAARTAAIAVADVATARLALTPGVTIGRVRLRLLSAAMLQTGNFYRGPENYVVEDGLPGERQAAEQLAKLLSVGGRTYSVKPNVQTKTKWYLSVFACGPAPAAPGA